MSFQRVQPGRNLARMLALLALFIAGAAAASNNQLAMTDSLNSLCDRSDLTSGLATACADPALLDPDSVAAITADELVMVPHSVLQMANGIQHQLHQQFAIAQWDGSPSRFDQEPLSLPATRMFTSLSQATEDWNSTELTPTNEQTNDAWLVGVSQLVATPFRVGFALGANDQETDFNQANPMNIKSRHLSLFANWFRDEFAVDSSLIMGRGSADLDRILAYGRAYSDTNFEFWSLQVKGRFYFTEGNWRFGPVASLTSTSYQTDQLVESGSSVWRVALDQQNTYSLQYVTGIQAQYQLSFQWGQLLPYGALLRGKEFRDREQARGGSLVELPQQTLSLTRDNFDDYWTLANAGLLVRLQSRFSAYADVVRLTDVTADEAYAISLGFNLSL